MITKNLGMLLLAIYLILVGLIGIFGISLGAASILLPILALVAGIIAVEKTLPWRSGVTYATTALLAGTGILLLVAPDALPWLTLPAGQAMPMG